MEVQLQIDFMHSHSKLYIKHTILYQEHSDCSVDSALSLQSGCPGFKLNSFLDVNDIFTIIVSV